ncbi:hypothetical protein PIB30_113869 [Stylosanthes scabra]|uniref:Uncharacterized protein n=1 Tax=Stylosanthes scabra TaxID=79078 RepID=A0ABU6V0U4_9FABA|nr:hypothetical protein [Stylosanthes scabra]
MLSLSFYRKTGSTSASTSKKHHTPNNGTATRISEVMTITKTLTPTDIKATRLVSTLD